MLVKVSRDVYKTLIMIHTSRSGGLLLKGGMVTGDILSSCVSIGMGGLMR